MDSIIRQMEKVESDVKNELRPSLAEIVAAAELYRRLGKDFTFSGGNGLDKKVNGILLALSNGILDDIDERIDFAISEAEAEDDSEDIRAYVFRDLGGETATDRIDRHVSRMKYVIEAGIAIGFAQKLARANIVSTLFQLVQNPTYKMLIPDARRGDGYAASYITDGDLNSGRGISPNIIKAIGTVGSTMIAEAFHYGKIQVYARKGAIGYGVQRNSSYDCPDCDEVCSVIHPLTEIVVPVHPHCCCSTYPIYPDDL